MEFNNNKNKFLSKDQKHFIGSTLSAVGIVFFLISIMLIITLTILVKFELAILMQALKKGDLLVTLAIALLTTGLVSFATGTTLQEK